MRLARLLVLLFCVGTPVFAGELGEPGFEGAVATVWRGPWGGGMYGGQGSGEIVDKATSPLVRSGRKAACLRVWDHNTSNAVAWSSLSQTMACSPMSRIRAEAWILSSPKLMPLAASGTVTQLRVEYFSDESAQRVIPTRAVLSEPFPLSAGHTSGRWRKIEVTDRVPSGALSMTVSIVLMTERPGAQPQAIWVDDVAVETMRPGH